MGLGLPASPSPTHTLPLSLLHQPLSLSLSHTFISPLSVDKEQLCLPLCTSLWKSHSLLPAEGPQLTFETQRASTSLPPAFWQHAFNANILKVNALTHSARHRLKGTEKKKTALDEKTTDVVSDLGPGWDPWLIFSLMYSIEFHPRKGRFHCWAMNGMKTVRMDNKK